MKLYIILLYSNRWMHTMYLVHQHKFTNKCTNLNYKLFISPELHDSLFVHASVAKRTCPTLANCHLVPWEISSIRNFSLTHQKFREILSFVLANYHSTTTNFNSTIKQRNKEWNLHILLALFLHNTVCKFHIFYYSVQSPKCIAWVVPEPKYCFEN